MQFRTDLAVEQELQVQEQRVGDLLIARQTRGNHTFITVTVPPLTDDLGGHTEELAALLAELLPKEGTVLVIGLGNDNITPDALGPKAVRQVLATRYMAGEWQRVAGMERLRDTAVLAPGVRGQTGMETGEIVQGLCAMLHPACVLVVDALAARSVARLGCTVQMTDAGIAPGSGVGAARQALTPESLGVPVIALGVPTVVDASTLAQDLTGAEQDSVSPRGAEMMVTPREVDLLIDRAAKMLADAINAALHPHVFGEGGNRP